MVERRPLVLNGNKKTELPAGDTLPDDLRYIHADGSVDFTATQNTNTLQPTTTGLFDLGSSLNLYRQVRSQLGIFVNGSGTINTPANSSHGGIIGGTQSGPGSNTHTLNGGSFPAITCIGNTATNNAGGTAVLESTKGGANIMASAFPYGTGTSTCRSSGYSSTVLGYAYGPGISRLMATNSASVAIAYANARSATGFSDAISSGVASVLFGMSRCFSGNGTSALLSSAKGSFASAYVESRSGFNATASASADGAMIVGNCVASTAIANLLASGKGALAVGDATNTTISATAQNSVQLGPGTNSTANSLQVGTGVQLFGDTGNGRFDGSVGIGQAVPTARLHLDAGTVAVNTAPLKFTSGPLLTTPETGAIEYENGHLYVTNTMRNAIVKSNGVKTTTTTVTNTAVETTIYSFNFPANALHADERIVFDTVGAYSNATASDDFTLRFKVGGVTIATVGRTGGNVTDQGWKAIFEGTIRSIGATGKFVHWSEYNDGVTNQIDADIVEHAIDTTIANLFEVTIQWTNAKAGNTFSCTQADLQFRH